MNELLDLYRDHRGKVTDRWLAYLHQYERIFAPWRDKPVRLLEIGIQNGGSLEIWARYFPDARILVGCDIDPLCERLTYDDPRISVVVGDASSGDTEARIGAISPQWDLVIEDGSHQSRHIVDAFARFFPRVVEGGMFIAEDLHCSYWHEFEGGLADPFSSIAFFKRLADFVNFEHWGVPLSRVDYLAGFAAHYGCRFDEASLARIHSVEFLNSQCVVRTRPPADNELGPRLIVGSIELVSSGAHQYDGTRSRALDQRANPWSDARIVDVAESDRYGARFSSMEAKALQATAEAAAHAARADALAAEVATLREALAARERTLSQLGADKVLEGLEQTRRDGEYRTHLASLMATIQGRDEQIASLMSVHATPAARVARLLERVAKRAFPARSLRRRALARALSVADRVYRHGPIGALRVVRSSPGGEGDASQIQGAVGRDAIAQPPEFAAWIQRHEPDEAELARQRQAARAPVPEAPLFSIIVPVYKIPPAVLEATIESVRAQTWQDWELCIAYADLENDENWALIERLVAQDPRLKARRLAENGGISRNSNAALEFASGEFIALLDHDDELTPWALHDMARRIAEVPEADFLYSDKDSINAVGTLRQNPLFKPAWSPEMMFSVNYLTHLNVMRRSVVEAVGGWNPDTDGAQDWDIFFRVTEKSRRVERVPGIHYHWRIIAGSTATGIGAKPYAALGQLRTLEMRIRREGLSATVLPDPDSSYRLAWHLDGRPALDVVLHGGAAGEDPTAALRRLVDQCDGLLASVTLAWTGAGEPPLTDGRWAGGVPLHVVRAQPSAPLTAVIADAVAKGRAPAVLLLDLAVVGIRRHSVQDLAGWVLGHPAIGFAGALVQLDDDTVVEAGRVVGQYGATQPLFRGTPLRHWGPLGGPLWYRNVSAAADTAIAFKRDRLQIERHREADWAQALVVICSDVCGADRRGIVSPHARVIVERMPPLVGAWHPSMRDDPYFHPAFKSVTPLELDTEAR